MRSAFRKAGSLSLITYGISESYLHRHAQEDQLRRCEGSSTWGLAPNSGQFPIQSYSRCFKQGNALAKNFTLRPRPSSTPSDNSNYKGDPEKTDYEGSVEVHINDETIEKVLFPRSRTKPIPKKTAVFKETKRHGLKSAIRRSRYICDVENCNSRFTQLRDLESHRVLEHSANPRYLKCAYANCQKAYTSRSELNRHTRIKHSDSSNHYQRGYRGCTHAFPLKTFLVEHTRKVHSGPAPSRFACRVPGCQKPFAPSSCITGSIIERPQNNSFAILQAVTSLSSGQAACGPTSFGSIPDSYPILEESA